jgi:hypothetical protein
MLTPGRVIEVRRNDLDKFERARSCVLDFNWVCGWYERESRLGYEITGLRNNWVTK